jgi:hypothetical protein
MNLSSTDVVVPNGAAADAATPDNVSSAADAATGGGDEPLFNKGEVIGLRKEVRQMTKLVETLLADKRTEKPVAKPGNEAASDVSSLRQQVENLTMKTVLGDALADAGYSFTAKQRQLLEAQFRSSKPEDVSAFISDMADTFGVTKGKPQTQQTTVPATEPRRLPYNTGSSAIAATGGVPDLIGATDDEWRSLDRQSKKKAFENFLQNRGVNGQLFAKKTR